MRPAQRASLGAIVGALFVVVLHPMLRPYVKSGLWAFGPSPVFTKTTSPHELTDPDTAKDAAQWVQTASAKILTSSLTTDQALLASEIAKQGAEREPTNAFWFQAEAVFQKALSNDDAAIAAWKKASRLPAWNDHQTERIKDVLKDLSAESGRELAWHHAAASSTRMHQFPRVVYSLGTNFATSPSLEMRYATMRNGVLLRNGSRSQQGARLGHDLVEAAAIGGRLTAVRPRKEVFDRFKFVTDLDQAGLRAEAKTAGQQLSDNEAWKALVVSAEGDENFERMCWQAALVSSLPGSLLAVSLFGAALMGLSLLLRPDYKACNLVAKLAPAIGVVAGAGYYAWTGLAVAAVFVTLVIAGHAIRPPHLLGGTPANLSFSFSATNTTLGAIAGGFLATQLSYWTPGTLAMSQLTEAPLTAPPVTAAVLVFALSLAGSLAWAYHWRRHAVAIGAKAILHFFAGMAISSVVCAVMATPVCISLDRSLSDDLGKLALNAPAYYLAEK